VLLLEWGKFVALLLADYDVDGVYNYQYSFVNYYQVSLNIVNSNSDTI
jgi:hypothetical protein